MSEPKLLPNRSIMHRWMSEAGSCDVCGGRGYDYNEAGFEVFAKCPCGRLRKSLYAEDHKEPANRIENGSMKTWPAGTPEPKEPT